jgi:hypothetical protein
MRTFGARPIAQRDDGNTVSMSTTVLLILAAVLVIFGILKLVRGDMLIGILLIVAGLLVGPGGVSVFS